MKNDKALTPEEQVQKIQEACTELEWYIALNDDNDEVKGLIIGNIEYIKNIIEQLDDMDEYQVWGRPNEPLH